MEGAHQSVVCVAPLHPEADVVVSLADGVLGRPITENHTPARVAGPQRQVRVLAISPRETLIEAVQGEEGLAAIGHVGRCAKCPLQTSGRAFPVRGSPVDRQRYV
jgi:hypothetical protein